MNPWFSQLEYIDWVFLAQVFKYLGTLFLNVWLHYSKRDVQYTSVESAKGEDSLSSENQAEKDRFPDLGKDLKLDTISLRLLQRFRCHE